MVQLEQMALDYIPVQMLHSHLKPCRNYILCAEQDYILHENQYSTFNNFTSYCYKLCHEKFLVPSSFLNTPKKSIEFSSGGFHLKHLCHLPFADFVFPYLVLLQQ